MFVEAIPSCLSARSCVIRMYVGEPSDANANVVSGFGVSKDSMTVWLYAGTATRTMITSRNCSIRIRGLLWDCEGLKDVVTARSAQSPERPTARSTPKTWQITQSSYHRKKHPSCGKNGYSLIGGPIILSEQ